MQLDSPRRIYDQPANPFVANFIGESTLLPVEHSDGHVSYAGTPVNVSGSESKDGRLLMLRPERLVLLKPGEEARSEEHTSELQLQAYLVCRLVLEKKKEILLIRIISTTIEFIW